MNQTTCETPFFFTIPGDGGDRFYFLNRSKVDAKLGEYAVGRPAVLAPQYAIH